MTTDIPSGSSLLDLIHTAAAQAGIDLTRDQIRVDAIRGAWYTGLAEKAFALGAAYADEEANRPPVPELPTITLPWTDGPCRVEVDDDGCILLSLDPGADGLAFDADEATEAAAALLEAARASRDITGERPTITLHAPALAAPATDVQVGPWRWELQIAGRLGSWVVHRHSTLAAADTAEGLARLIADQHLEDRPAELAHTPWRVLVWRAGEKTLTPSTAVALVTSFGMTLAAALRDSGIAGVLATGRGGRSILRPELARAARTGGGPAEFPRVNSTPADPETCGDCASGKCHGGDGPDGCGCALHEASTRDPETGELLIRDEPCRPDHDPTCAVTDPGAECCGQCPDRGAPEIVFLPADTLAGA